MNPQIYGLPQQELVINLASYWLQTDCSPPHWCGGADINQDSAVNMQDFSDAILMTNYE